MESESGEVVIGGAFERVIDKLEGVDRKNDHQVMARCPVHEDRNPSLSVTQSDDGVLLHCFGGCPNSRIVNELGLNWSDLFDIPDGQKRPPKPNDEWYDYTNEAGTPIYSRKRFYVWDEVKDDWSKRFAFFHANHLTTGLPEGMPQVLYQLPEVIEAVHEGTTVHLLEGEKDVHSLEGLGLIATTVGSSTNWGNVAHHAREVLHGANIIIVPDRDKAGWNLVRQEAEGLRGIAATIIIREPIIGKDVSDHLAAGKLVDELAMVASTVDDAFRSVDEWLATDQDEDPIEYPWRPKLDWHQVFNHDSESEWLVQGMWPEGRSLACHAPHKTGKSLVSLYQAAKLAIGVDPFTGSKRDPVRSTYLDDEMTPEDVRERLEDMGFEEGQMENLSYYQYCGVRDLDTRQGGELLMDLIRTDRSRALFIDTFSRFVKGDENSNDTYRNYHLHTGTLLKREGVSSNRLDHEGHSNGSHARGASAKGDDVDIVFRIEPRDGGFNLRRMLTRLSGIPEKIELQQRENPLAWSTTTENLYPPGTGAKAAEMDRANVPIDAGRDVARRMLKLAGFTPGNNNVLSAALRYRRDPITLLLKGNR